MEIVRNRIIGSFLAEDPKYVAYYDFKFCDPIYTHSRIATCEFQTWISQDRRLLTLSQNQCFLKVLKKCQKKSAIRAEKIQKKFKTAKK